MGGFSLHQNLEAGLLEMAVAGQEFDKADSVLGGRKPVSHFGEDPSRGQRGRRESFGQPDGASVRRIVRNQKGQIIVSIGEDGCRRLGVPWM